MTRKKRLFAALLALAFVCALSFSAFAVSAGCGHECSGENCFICLTVSGCSEFLGIAALLCAFGSLFAAESGISHTAGHARLFTGAVSTPVSMKIKLSD